MSVVTFNRSIASLVAQRRLGEVSETLGATYQRLSSGQRINRASDDAAGLAVALSLNANTRIYTQAIRNVNDGISALTIAQGGIQNLSHITTRIQELAEQAANGSYSATQRQALNSEAQALVTEYSRIVSVTSFNNRTLLDGTFTSVGIQAGTGDLERLDISISSLIQNSTTYVGTGTFSAGVTYVEGGTLLGISAYDFNGDGKLDVAAGDNTNNKLLIMLGNGDGSFKSSVSYVTGTAPTGVQYGDLNGDGKIDIVTTDQTSNVISVFLGNADGSFKARVSYSALGSSVLSDPEIIDINGDSKLDVLVMDSSRVGVYFGNGDGTFKAETSYFSQSAGSLSYKDLNGDGYIDFVTENNNHATVSVFLANNNGTFLAPVDYTTGANPSDIQIADVNADSVYDLITVNSTGENAAYILLGNSNGTFKAKVSYAVGVSPRAALISDINADGYVDLLSTDGTDNTVSLLLGNGNGTFKARSTISSGDSPRILLAGDFTGDGVNDLLTNVTAGAISLMAAGSTTSSAPSLNSISLLTQSSALSSLTIAQSLLDSINEQAGRIGAYESRLNVASNVLAVSRENYMSAYSRIMDADVAQETATLISSQIRQKAAQAVLVQANQSPQLSLQLL